MIKLYNNSDVYALAAGHLADRLRGGAPFHAAWPKDDPQLSRDARIALQRKLASLGYAVKDFAGRLDFDQRDAIRDLQAKPAWWRTVTRHRRCWSGSGLTCSRRDHSYNHCMRARPAPSPWSHHRSGRPPMRKAALLALPLLLAGHSAFAELGRQRRARAGGARRRELAAGQPLQQDHHGANAQRQPGVRYPAGHTILVKADSVVCRASNVDISAHSCQLKFGARSRATWRAARAHELYATIAEIGVRPDGAAGSVFEALSTSTAPSIRTP